MEWAGGEVKSSPDEPRNRTALITPPSPSGKAGMGLLFLLLFISLPSFSQTNTRVSARLDARQITVGDQAKLFIEVQHDPAAGKLQWPVFPDTFNNLEIVDRGKIDTLAQGGRTTYRQRLLITGFDSGYCKIPSFPFTVIPASGTPTVVQSDSLQLLVQTVPVDTTKEFKPIKNIIFVKSTWLDYIWYIIGGIVFLGLLVFVLIYFLRNKKVAVPKPAGPVESLQDKTLRLLGELDARQLWQKNQVKEYYVELTDIVRNYIEHRFRTPAMELTTDELLDKSRHHRDMQPHTELLASILHTADLAKFAKWQPLPQEHFDAMDHAKKFVDGSRPPIVTETPTEKNV